MRVVYSTVLTEGFAPPALALARSLVEVSPEAEVLLFCLDAGAARILNPIVPERCTVVPFDEIMTDTLRSAGKTMKISAFCWLLKPHVLEYAMNAREHGEWFCYVDADMMAFADPQERLAQAGERSVVVTPHAFRYPQFVGTEYLFGHYNAGFIAFRGNETGRNILTWWKAKCVEHCPAEPEPDAFGDQKYVEQLVHRFYDDVSVGFPFTNCAAWNIGADAVDESAKGVTWRGRPIMIYHFQGLRLLEGGWVDLYADAFPLSSSVKAFLYKPYVRALRKAVSDIRQAKLSDKSFTVHASLVDRLHRFVLTLFGRRSLVYWP